MSEACPALPDGWKVDEDWSEHECFYDEDANDEWCIRVFRVYGPDGEVGPGGPQPVEAVNAAIDAGLLPGLPRWRYSTEEELAAERQARIDRAIAWTQRAHARNIAAIPLESQHAAVVEYALRHRRPTELDYEVALAAAKALCFTREGDDGPVSTWREFTAYVDEVLKERTLKREK